MGEVLITDVGPRDGLQSQSRVYSAALRAELCARLAATGIRRVEAASFVNPKSVPTMAGGEEVVARLGAGGAVWSGLVLNEKGYGRARGCGVDLVNFTVAATDAFSVRNQGCTADEAIASLAEIARREAPGRLIATIAVAFGCPFEGEVRASRVVEIAARLAAAGIEEVVIADTIGVAVPTQVRELVGGLRDLGIDVGCHFHDTRNTGLANAIAAVERGVRKLDSSIGGLGGCPFAPGATGNLATEDLVFALEKMGVDTGIDLSGVLELSSWVGSEFGLSLASALARAGVPQTSAVV